MCVRVFVLFCFVFTTNSSLDFQKAVCGVCIIIVVHARSATRLISTARLLLRNFCIQPPLYSTASLKATSEGGWSALAIQCKHAATVSARPSRDWVKDRFSHPPGLLVRMHADSRQCPSSGRVHRTR